MGLKQMIRPLVPKAFLKPAWRGIEDYAFDWKTGPAEDIQAKYGFSGDLVDIYVANQGSAVHKWHHYLPIYERYFAAFRNRPIRFLEIGVSQGGSLQMWRKYFGPDAVIFGVDIDENCRQFDGQAAQVRIGSQDDPDFLKAVVSEMGGLDLVLDDGSHVMKHIRASLDCLFPLLGEGGVYMIEDLQTAYWDYYGGGYQTPGNFFRFAAEIADDMHHWYHDQGIKHPALTGSSAIHIHDSLVVLEKTAPHRPVHSVVK